MILLEYYLITNSEEPLELNTPFFLILKKNDY